MTGIYIALAAIFAVGICAGLYAMFAPRAAPPAQTPGADPPPETPLETAPPAAAADWTTEAGGEFAGLPEAARCDLIFAVCDLRDERSHQMLVHALDDPSDAVALAAAHVLAQRGRSEDVHAYAQQNAGERARRLVDTLALLG